MYASLEQIVRNAIGVWTGSVSFEEHAVYAIMTFLPVIILVVVFEWLTSAKELNKLRNALLVATAIVAALPYSIPIGIAYLIYRHFFPEKKKPATSPSAARS